MMHALVLLSINQYTKFDVSSFTNYKDITKAKFKKESHDSNHTPFRVVSHHRLWFDTVYNTCMQNLMIPASSFQRYHWGHQNLKWVA